MNDKPVPTDVTALLTEVSTGDQEAINRLFSVVYGELHALAHAAIRREPPGGVLQTTALIHEAYLRLVPGPSVRWQDRRHFFRTAARAMRRILVSEARKRKAAKRGAGRPPLSLEAADREGLGPTPQKLTYRDLDEMDRVLEKMGAQEDLQRTCAVVDLLFFAGFTQEEAAEILGVSKGTVRRDWEFAKVWLREEIQRERGRDG